MPSGPIRYLTLTSVAFVLTAATLLGAGLGYLADQKLGTFPWLTTLGLVIGMVAGVVEMLQMLRESGAG